MAGTPADAYESAISTLERAVESGDVAADDARAIRCLCAAFDPDDLTEPVPAKHDLYGPGRAPTGAGDAKETRTLGAWAERLTALAQGVDSDDGAIDGVDLTAKDTTADDVNRFITELNRLGDISTSHARNIGYAASKFYRFHDDLGVDTDRIRVPDYDGASGNGWDARDLLTAEERAALRTVCRNARDRCVYHMLLYTGIRNTALRTLRVKDVEPRAETPRFFFNTSADGLKNITNPDQGRTLNQATRAVQDWLNDHPDPQPDHYLITGLPRASKKDPTEPMTAETIRYTMESIKERTHERDDVLTVQKPCHPHMMRHNFVSMAVKNPDISDRNIKHQIGHAQESDVMQTTYSHIAGEEHNQAFDSAFGPGDDGDDDGPPPWDNCCDTCHAVLAPGDDLCATCGADRGPTPWGTAEPTYDPDANPYEVMTEEMADAFDRVGAKTGLNLAPIAKDVGDMLMARGRALEADDDDIQVVDDG